jgi:hypothetical protein
MKHILFSFSFLLVFTFCKAQTLQQQPPLAMVLLEMAAHNRYESSFVGFAALKSKQYERYEQLMTLANREQLLDLAEHHNNGVVRLYAYQALHQKKMAIPEALASLFRKDNTKVNIMMGCVIDSKPISTLAPHQIKSNNLKLPKEVRLNK